MSLTTDQKNELLSTLKDRFDRNMNRHPNHLWEEVFAKIHRSDKHLLTLLEMERTGGEPDVADLEVAGGTLVFCDCAAESPKGRRSLCYDREALEARKEHKPANSAMDLAAEIGIQMLDEALYRRLQQLGTFDTKTSSWLRTPPGIRKLGGAIFGDYRYGQVFIYHNGAESYYGARGFRGMLTV